jgi:hypothetical protein
LKSGVNSQVVLKSEIVQRNRTKQDPPVAAKKENSPLVCIRATTRQNVRVVPFATMASLENGILEGIGYLHQIMFKQKEMTPPPKKKIFECLEVALVTRTLGRTIFSVVRQFMFRKCSFHTRHKTQPVSLCAFGLHYPLCHYENVTKDRQEAGAKTYMLQILSQPLSYTYTLYGVYRQKYLVALM